MTEDPVDPTPCPHRGCSGCPLIHLEYENQMIEKRARVERAFARFALDTATIQPAIGAKEQWGYRTRTKWTLGNSGSLGLYREGSFDVMDLPNCPIVPTVVANVGNVLRQRISKALSAPSPERHWLSCERGGLLRGVDLRHVVPPTGSEKVIVSLIFNEDKTTNVFAQVKDEAQRLLRENPTIAAFFVVWGEGDSHNLISGRSEIVDGPSELPDVVGESVLLATGGAFVQAHRTQAGELQRVVRSWLTTSRSVGTPSALVHLGKQKGHSESAASFHVKRTLLDVFGGSGMFSIAMAKQGYEVTLLESFPPAVEQARKLAESTGVALRVRLGDAEASAEQILREGKRFDDLIVNPPRRGVPPKLRASLSGLAKDRLVYVSCHPRTLARDLADFERMGWLISSTTPVDMMPQTREVETVVCLSRAQKQQRSPLHTDDSMIALVKYPHEPIEELLEVAKNAYRQTHPTSPTIELVPVVQLDPELSGICLFASDENTAKLWREALHGSASKVSFEVLCKGHCPKDGRINKPLHTRRDSPIENTRYKRREWVGPHSLVTVYPRRADADQVKRHMALIGFPILGDKREGHAPTNRFFWERLGLDRAFLHWTRLEVEHPITHQLVVLDVPLANDLLFVLEELRSLECSSLPKTSLPTRSTSRPKGRR